MIFSAGFWASVSLEFSLTTMLTVSPLASLDDGFQGLVVQCYFAAAGLNDEVRIGVLCDFL